MIVRRRGERWLSSNWAIWYFTLLMQSTQIVNTSTCLCNNGFTLFDFSAIFSTYL
jgi:hypothetical protein